MKKILLTCITLALLVPGVHADASPDTIISEDTLWHDTVVEVERDLVVASGATLRVEGAHVLVGREIVVEEGARLELGPGSGAARLAPRGDLFSISVHGHLSSSGEPRTIIEGLAGDGINSILLVPGGIKITGTADLRDVIVRDGQAGVIVEEGAVLDLTDADVQDLYLMGVAVMGQAHMERVHFRDNIISVSGKGAACSVTARDIVASSWAAAFQMNRCPLELTDSQLLNGSETLVFYGGAPYTVERTEISGYMMAGVRAEGGSVMLRDVSLEGGREAWQGIEARDSRLEMHNVTIFNHNRHGLTSQGSDLVLDAVRAWDNRQTGLDLVGGTLAADIEALELGTGDEAFRPISWRIVATAYAAGADGHPVEGLTVTVVRDGQTVATAGPSGPVPLTFGVETFGIGKDGRPTPATGLAYRAEHPLLGAPIEGTLDPGRPLIVVELGQEEAHSSTPLPVWVLLAALAILGRRAA